VKVLIAHNRYRSALPSGENVVVDDDISLLRAAGVEVVPLIEESDSIPGLGLVGKVGVATGPVFNPSGVGRIRRMLAVHKPDVVHVHNVFPLLSPWIVRTAHEAGVPVVQTVHNFRQDCVAGTYFRDGHVCTDCVGRRLATPALQHGCYRGSRLQTLPMVVGRALHQSTWRSVDRFLVLTSFHASHLESLGVPAERIVIRPTSMADPGAASKPRKDILFVGRLDPEKGVELLLDAWAQRKFGDRRLIIGGDGPLAPLVRERAAVDDSISYRGRLSPSEVAAAMESAAAVALPSVWLEGLPRVAVEAMARGRAVLAVNHGGLATVVDESSGWLLPPDVASWARALGTLADHDVRRRGAGARAAFEKRFSQTVTTRQLLATYDELLAS
jgi:glycosyltransferase involved in cell wall biosynthesis